MKHYLAYKQYYGSVDFDPDDNVLFGQLAFIKATISYEGETIQELKQAFEEAVDDYLEMCEQIGMNPEQPLKGSFNVRIGRELHQQAALEASKLDISLNEFVKKAVADEITQLRVA